MTHLEQARLTMIAFEASRALQNWSNPKLARYLVKSIHDFIQGELGQLGEIPLSPKE
jgi:hypothetical protein